MAFWDNPLTWTIPLVGPAMREMHEREQDKALKKEALNIRVQELVAAAEERAMRRQLLEEQLATMKEGRKPFEYPVEVPGKPAVTEPERYAPYYPGDIEIPEVERKIIATTPPESVRTGVVTPGMVREPKEGELKVIAKPTLPPFIAPAPTGEEKAMGVTIPGKEITPAIPPKTEIKTHPWLTKADVRAHPEFFLEKLGIVPKTKRNLKEFYNAKTGKSLWLDPDVEEVPEGFKSLEVFKATKEAMAGTFFPTREAAEAERQRLETANPGKGYKITHHEKGFSVDEAPEKKETSEDQWKKDWLARNPGKTMTDAGAAYVQFTKITAPSTVSNVRVEKQTAQGLRKDFNNEKAVSNFKIMHGQMANMDAAYQRAQKDPKSLLAADRGMVKLFEKMLEPNSVVMPSEAMQYQLNMSIGSRIEAWISRVAKGGTLTKDERDELFALAKDLYAQGYKIYQEQEEAYRTFSKENELKPELVVPKFEPNKKFLGGETSKPSEKKSGKTSGNVIKGDGYTVTVK